MKQKMFLKLSLMSAFALSMLAGCEKDVDVDLDSPASVIRESEKLEIPAAIELPANTPSGNSRVMTLYAEGVQKYKAQQKVGTPGTYEWVFVAPQADLYDATNKKVGTHSAGPTWQLFGSTDSIYAQQFTPAKAAPSSDPRSIDWLLLMTKTGKTPTGAFSSVAYIHRIATEGGKAPTIPPTSLTDVVEVKYTAVYRFIKKN